MPHRLHARSFGIVNTLTLIECGRLAREALSSGGGEICAVFRRSIYLRASDQRYVCLGDIAIGHGPINGAVRALPSLALGTHVSIQLGDEVIWSPEHIGGPPDPFRLAGNLHSLERAAAARVCRDGLGGALIGEDSRLLRHAQPALQAFDRWLDSASAPVPGAVHALIGLGPGLTPSGDDYLSGALVALRAIGKGESADQLWQSLRGVAGERTHPISRAHLAAAAAGEANEALHVCLGQLLGNDDAPWEGALARLDAVGHCSGWDGLAGAAAVARSVLRQGRALQ